MITARKVSVTISMLALGLAACKGKSPEAPPPRDATEASPPITESQAPPDMPPAGPPQGAPGSAGPSGEGGQTGAQTGTPLLQDQIVAITSAVDSGEINRAQLAQTMAKGAKVKKLAERLANDHLDNKNKLAELAQRLQLSPVDSPTQRQLATDAERATESLRAYRDVEFDRAYVDAEIRAHLGLIDLLDNRLIPSARDADLRKTLQDSRSREESHLKDAQDLQKDLAAGK